MDAIIGKRNVGKSSILKSIMQKGYTVLDCDKWVHEQYESCNSIVYKNMIKKFGKEIVTNSIIDREKLKKLIIKDKTILDAIMEITHTALFQYLTIHTYDYVEVSAFEYSPIDFSKLFETIYKINRSIKVEKFYEDIIKIKHQVEVHLINMTSIEDAVKEILKK